MAISVLAVGASGIVAMQKVAVSANRSARSLAVANEVARTWLETLRADALQWNHPSSRNPVSDRETDTMWLGTVMDSEPAENEGWFRPSDGVSVCGIHDVFGRSVACAGAQEGPYCVNLRLSWIRDSRQLIRAEVRVYWIVRNEGDDALSPDELPCGSATDPPDVNDLAMKGVVRVVHAVSAIAKNEAP